MTDYRNNDGYRELSPEELERRRRIRARRRKEQLKKRRRRLIAMMALVLIVIILIIVLCVSCSHKKSAASGKNGKADTSVSEDTGTEKDSETASGSSDATDVTPESPAGTQIPEDQLASIDIDDYFTVSEISDQLYRRIEGWSYRDEGNLSRDQLSYIKVLHKNASGAVCIGELIVNSEIADDTLAVFRELYDASVPIEHMILVDSFEADDYLAMEADATFCFNDNMNSPDGETPVNSFGNAINVNPLYNPFIPDEYRTIPENAGEYADRDRTDPYMIHKGDACYNAFIEHGFIWAGDNEMLPNYMRFEHQ